MTSTIPTYTEYHIDRDITHNCEALVAIRHVSVFDVGSTVASKLEGFPSDSFVSKGIVDLGFEPCDDVSCWCCECHVEIMY